MNTTPTQPITYREPVLGPSLAVLIITIAWALFLAVALHELDGRYARQRRNECADLRMVWHYQGDYCAREEVQ